MIIVCDGRTSKTVTDSVEDSYGCVLCVLQRASALIGSFRVKIGASKNLSGETFFWTKPTDFCRTTNSRYSVRYIRLYVNCTPTYNPTSRSVH